MIPNLSEVAIIIAAAPTLILLMFLPAFIELKKPKDNGPRIISMEGYEVNAGIARFIPFANIEDDQKFDSSLLLTIAKIVDFLPSLEA